LIYCIIRLLILFGELGARITNTITISQVT
jgi:hypothetical protein